MRQITKDAIKSFYAGKDFKQSNTEVKAYNNSTNLYLFGNHIAELEHNATVDNESILKITNAGYETVTTKERLNGLEGVNIVQRDFVWYLNGKEWNGNWIEVETQ